MSGSSRKFLRAVAVWLLIITAETVHGTARTILLEPMIGGPEARRIAVFTGSALIFAIAWMTIRWLGERATGRLLSIGLLWVLLTVAFEAVLGRLVLGLSWERLLADYDLSGGGLMAIGLLLMALSPLAAARLRGSA